MITVLLSAVLVLAVLFGSYNADRDGFFYGLLSTAVILAAVTILLGIQPLPFVLTHWREILVGFAAYVAAGVPWAFVKWWRYVVLARQRLEAWLPSHPVPVPRVVPADAVPKPGTPMDRATSDHLSALYTYAASVPGPIRYDMSTGKFVLPASDHKSRIVTWLAFWPLSILGTVLGDFLLRIFENVVEALRGSFQRISDSALSGVNKK